jgi:periplasmic divalent cation tolerance protein
MFFDMAEILVLSTTATLEVARTIAAALVESGEAACVNIIPGVCSIYRWEGKVCEDSEFLLLVKSRVEKFESIRATIKRLHSYQIPEIIALPINAGDPEYLRWLADSTQANQGDVI